MKIIAYWTFATVMAVAAGGVIAVLLNDHLQSIIVGSLVSYAMLGLAGVLYVKRVRSLLQ
jgi:hypothetical protein